MKTRRNPLALVTVAGVLATSVPVGATYRTDRMEIQARVAAQNAFHHDSFGDYEWVQERNEFRFDLKYNLIPWGQRFLGIQRARLNLLYRARYDAVFDLRGHYGDLGYDRDDFRFPEGKIPREAFLDLEIGGPFNGLSLRLGRQQVVWGEADVFRSLDVVNPLRLDQNGLIGEDFSDYREPLWILKSLYEMHQIGPVTQPAIEWFGSLNSRPVTDRIVVGEAFRIGVDTNNPVHGFDRRNSRPFSEVRHPWEITRIGPDRTDAQDFAELGPLLGDADFVYQIDNQWPTSTFDTDAAMTGVRFLGQIFNGSLNFTLNYVWKRVEIPGTALRGGDLFDQNLATDGSPNFRLDRLTDAATAAALGQNDEQIRRCVEKEPVFVLDSVHGSGNATTGCIGVPFWYPWTHIAGLTLTYNDYNYTGAIFRLEQSWSSKEPGNHKPPLANDRAGDFPHQRDFDTEGRRTTQVYRSMIGFDYLRAVALPAARQWPQPFRSIFTDQWLFSVQLFNQYYTHVASQIGLLDSVTDRIQHWNPMMTFVATGFFVNNRLRPWIAAAYEVNTSFPILWLQADYALTPKWTIRFSEILYMGSRFDENFLYLNKYADRDTFSIRLTYWLL